MNEFYRNIFISEGDLLTVMFDMRENKNTLIGVGKLSWMG
jgi:hypothetical protein